MRAAVLLTVLTATTAAAEGRKHALSVYAQSAVSLYLSRHQTAGGVGGGAGVRDTIDDRFFVQADLSYLVLLGNAARLRLGGGVQRQGLWQPAALLTGSVYLGDRLTFLTPQRPVPLAVPPFTVGAAVAPLRFSLNGTTVNVLEVGVGWGWDFPGSGLAYSATLLEVAVAL